jgi:hypothetical protein
VIGLLDGGIELWSAREPTHHGDYHQLSARHIQSLMQMNEQNATVAGFIDDPAANPVIRMLELSASKMFLEERPHPEGSPLFAGVSDRGLFGRILKAGERSAVFALRSLSSEIYVGELALHFFYINTAEYGSSHIARVEIPAWIAEDSEKIGTLQAALVDQCRLIDGVFYPYVLGRAHEEAVLREGDRKFIDALIRDRLAELGLAYNQPSPKQQFKHILG